MSLLTTLQQWQEKQTSLLKGRTVEVSRFLSSNHKDQSLTTHNDTYYNMTVWILAGNYSSFTIAAGLIRLHMPGVKKSCV